MHNIEEHDQLINGSAQSWLSGRSQQVVVDGEASEPVPVISGVLLGLVLGMIIFLIFINDLPDNIKSLVRLFADDCVIIFCKTVSYFAGRS